MELIKDLTEFIQVVTELPHEVNKDGSKCLYAFRGQDSHLYELVPKIGRNRENSYKISILDYEEALIYEVRCELPNLIKKDMEPIEILASLQHLGVSTRLLDITTNPLVALYFACCKNPDNDGEVFVFKYKNDKTVNCPIKNAIAESYKFCSSTNRSLTLFYDDVIDQPYFDSYRRMFKNIDRNESDKKEYLKECCSKPMFIKSPLNLLRQKLQSGMYIIFPNKIVNDKFVKEIEPISKESDCIAKIIRIDKNAKSKLLKQLSIVGINEEYLFNDDYDKVCSNIERRFSVEHSK